LRLPEVVPVVAAQSVALEIPVVVVVVAESYLAR
jgi:hypothetical protein